MTFVAGLGAHLMNAWLTTELRGAAGPVLERLLGGPATLVDASEPRIEGAHVAWIAFDGPASGRLEAAFSGAPIDALARAMIGDDAFESRGDDALGELANVIAGHVLPRLGGGDAVFTTAPPRAGAIDPERAPEARVAFTALGGRVDVALHLLGGTLPRATRWRPAP